MKSAAKRGKMRVTTNVVHGKPRKRRRIARVRANIRRRGLRITRQRHEQTAENENHTTQPCNDCSVHNRYSSFLDSLNCVDGDERPHGQSPGAAVTASSLRSREDAPTYSFLGPTMRTQWLASVDQYSSERLDIWRVRALVSPEFK